MPWAGTLYEDRVLRQKEMDITDKWLGEIGGWQAMKAARSLLGAGVVEVTERTPETVRGTVGQGKNRVTSGLRFRSRSDVENLCTCLTSRRDGRICDHSLAVALASLNPPATQSASSPTAPARSAVAAPPPRTLPANTTGQWSVFLPPSLLEPSQAMPMRTASSARPLVKTAKPPLAFVQWDSQATETSALNAWLASRGVERQSCPLQLPESEWPSFLAALTDHPRVFSGRPGSSEASPISVTDVTIRPLLNADLKSQVGSGDMVQLAWAENRRPHRLNWTDRQGRTHSWLYHQAEKSLHPWPLPEDTELRRMVEAWLTQPESKPLLQPLDWWIRHAGNLHEVFQISTSKSLQERYRIVPVPFRCLILLNGHERAVRLQVTAVFQRHSWDLMEASNLFPFVDEGDTRLFYARNVNREKQVLRQLEDLGLQSHPQNPNVFELQGERAVTAFFASQLPQLEALFEVRSDESWQRATRNWMRIQPSLRPQATPESGALASGIDWLSASIDYRAADGFQLGRSEVLRMLRSGQLSVTNKRSQRYIIDAAGCEEFEESLSDVPLQLTSDGARFQSRYAGFFLPASERQALAATQDQESDLKQLSAELGDLGSRLRPYQLEGVAWVRQRLKAGQGALLADDMGLGKTLQSIAAIVLHLANSTAPKAQALVICPKSLIFNWVAEMERFAPHLKVLAITGNQREKQFAAMHAADVIITSYHLIYRDLEKIKAGSFELAVLDEASFIRNPETETAKAIRSLPIRSVLALSGTPIENGVRDLWSIFEVLLPGYLGNRSHFQERFEKPLQAPDSPQAHSATQRLRRLIRPFFLRRTKAEVLKELPEKIEQVLWCEPSPAQAELYRRLLEEGREEIRQAKRRSGRHGARMTMLTLLLRLRQTCCDFRITGVTEPKDESLSLEDWSGKWPVLIEALNEALASQSKVLIFSQFVANLHYLRDILEGLNIGYSYLDGSTQDRAGAITTFQNNPKCPVFLISLKAGGYGLNLTQADRVFLLDPWWNPAVEAQAIDRAHRFGQTRSVNAYRLIMRGTVEERILELQKNKRGLIAAAIEERAPMMSGLTEDDLSSLLEIE